MRRGGRLRGATCGSPRSKSDEGGVSAARPRELFVAGQDGAPRAQVDLAAECLSWDSKLVVSHTHGSCWFSSLVVLVLFWFFWFFVGSFLVV